MLHHWAQATDGTGSAVRVVLFDYRKAFDFIDHHLLTRKILGLDIPRGVSRWVIDFLANRKQRVKLSADCLSEWGPVPSGVPQGTKLGPWLFLLMINDLHIPNVQTWKYVDDTTVAEIVQRESPGDAQSAVSQVEDWSRENNMQLNADKCKVMVIDFKRNKHDFSPLTVDGKPLETVDNAKILGVTLSNDLKWNTHICECIKKANTRLYFLVQLKRARVPIEDIVNFYCTTIRSVMEYASQVYHHALPAYLSDDIERVQRRAMRIIFPGVSYEISLERCGLSTLSARRAVLCDRLFDTLSLPSHKLNYMLPGKHNATYNTRHKRTFILPRMHTDRYRKSFIPAMCSRVNKGGGGGNKYRSSLRFILITWYRFFAYFRFSYICNYIICKYLYRF